MPPVDGDWTPILLPMGLGIAAPAEAAPPAKSLLTPDNHVLVLVDHRQALHRRGGHQVDRVAEVGVGADGQRERGHHLPDGARLQ